MSLQFETRLASGQEVLDRDIRDLHLVTGAEGMVLYAGTGRNGGLSVYEIAPGSAVQLVDATYFESLPAGIAETRLGTLTVDGDEVLVVGTGSGGSLIYFELAPDAGFGAPGAAGMAAADLTAWVADGLDGGRFYAIDRNTGGISAYEMSQGELQRVTPAMGALPEGSLMTTVSTPAGPVLVVAEGGGVSELVSYRAPADGGTLRLAGRAGPDEGLGLAAPTVMESITAYGASWVIVAGAGSDTLSVLRVASGGQLIPTDHVLDTLDTRFGDVQALAVIEARGQVFVFAGGGDDGLSVFSLLPNGYLVHRQSLADAQGLGLNDITAIEVGLIGDEIHVFVASEGMPGLSQFSWGVGGLGQVRDGTAALIQGTAGDDVLLAPETGSATLIGGAGDDILVSGDGAASLRGGAGADIFVLSATDAPLHIVDFQPGQDRLDLSLLPMLRTPGQLTVTPLPDGVQLGFQSFQVVITSASGGLLDVLDIWSAGGFAVPDRLLIDTVPTPQVIIGSDMAEVLGGGEGRDTVRAAGGDDTLWGADGADSLDGGWGRDQIWGGRGEDTIHGGTGNDRIGSGAESDEVGGGQGDDTLNAGSGDDTIYGNDGHDKLAVGGGENQGYGGSGNDTLSAGRGNDILAGGAGDDVIRAGGGSDVATGWIGDDTIKAGAGNDTIQAGTGNDKAFGGTGDDEIWMGSGNDFISGWAGDDTIRAGAGNDDLWGGSGRDVLNGGSGNDTLRGGADADVFVFSSNHGQDHIFDFDPGQDLIEISGGTGFSDLAFQRVVGGTRIESNLGTILLERVEPGQLSVDDFLFS